MIYSYNVLLITFFSFLLFHSTISLNPLSAQNDEYFGIFPDDYYDPEDYGIEPSVPKESDKDNSKQSTTPIDTQGINFIAAGDWKCNKETEKTITNVLKFKPELIVGLGDYLFENTSAKCWFDLSKPINDLMRIAIGNHDLDFAASYKQLIDHYGLKKPYYSFNFGNIHFIAISTEHPFQKGSMQYDFIKNDLEKTSADPNILWKIVFLHKPFYSASHFDENASEDLRKAFQRMFEENGVDIVLNGHTQYYQRSLPLSYNKENPLYPIVTNQQNYEYKNNNGIIFITAGTAGDNLQNIDFYLPYTVIQKRSHGFLNFDIKDNGNTLVGTFYDNKKLIILDKFTLSKNENGKDHSLDNFNSISQEYYSTAEINGENKNQQPSSYSSIHQQNYPLDNYDKMSFRN
jgi:hypothetical protein